MAASLLKLGSDVEEGLILGEDVREWCGRGGRVPNA
ncbi:predicted protein [Sclerotinia sclerotiorum 1980 UF-70]|uniref:Uncharacterized protein n=1 Tax=Sclerotinia sclerotiorum (strain ATCC 18683 / 1980 / Ss-1) TaxID=665079 RepID=A7EE75_SCLS1|nr:predicted protein [Sclerotinia sclerotiorum 1980 UF-70]EDO01141.1 predicted protein [Sclerotinia sclerotiorum 1980 UF-70]